MTTINNNLYSHKILHKFYLGSLNKVRIRKTEPTTRRECLLLFKLKWFKKKCLSISIMNTYVVFKCDGVKYILGDDACVYFNRKNKGLYTKV